MGCGSSSGLTSGKQVTFEQEMLGIQASNNEAKIMEDYIKNILPSTSPLVIPSSAKITIQDKDSYIQVKYQWTRIEYKYLSRWHTRTPNAPIDEGDSWCVERQLPGIGAGPNARPAKREVLVGENEWVPKEKWDAAIRDKKNGKLIEEKKKMLTIDIGMFKNNYDFYNGYEGECEVVLSIKSNQKLMLHIWEGYFEDIFGKPVFNENGWNGFTRDYQEGMGVFSEDGKNIIVNIKEYLADLKHYEDEFFPYEATRACLNLLIVFFEYAQEINSSIELHII